MCENGDKSNRRHPSKEKTDAFIGGHFVKTPMLQGAGEGVCGSCVMLACCVGVAAGQHALAALCWCGQVQRGAAAVGAAAQAASLQRLSGSGGAVPPALVALRSCGQLRAGAATVGPAAHAVADV
jgi:hypothetical protein